MPEINKTTLVFNLYYLGQNKYGISLTVALAKHQFTVKFTELSVDLLIILISWRKILVPLLFVLFRKTRKQPLLCLYLQY